MSEITPERSALADALRALRDIAGLDPDRPTGHSKSEKVAERSLSRCGDILGLDDLDRAGHTPRPNEPWDGVTY